MSWLNKGQSVVNIVSESVARAKDGDLATGEAILMKAMEIEPRNVLVRYHHARFLAGTGRVDEARAAIEETLGMASGQEREALVQLLRLLDSPSKQEETKEG